MYVSLCLDKPADSRGFDILLHCNAQWQIAVGRLVENYENYGNDLKWHLEQFCELMNNMGGWTRRVDPVGVRIRLQKGRRA